jgi:hypothetical protein
MKCRKHKKYGSTGKGIRVNICCPEAAKGCVRNNL